MTTQQQADRRLPDPAVEPTISVARAAAVLGVSPRVVYYSIKSRECPSVRVGRRIVIPTARFLRRYGLDAEDPQELM